MWFLDCVLKRVFLGVVLLLAVVDAFAGEDGRAPFLLVEDPWPPYTFGQAGEVPESGLIVELMDELFTRIGHPVRYGTLSMETMHLYGEEPEG